MDCYNSKALARCWHLNLEHPSLQNNDKNHFLVFISCPVFRTVLWHYNITYVMIGYDCLSGRCSNCWDVGEVGYVGECGEFQARVCRR